jgi:membrane fusion protein, multidrug efflux system
VKPGILPLCILGMMTLSGCRDDGEQAGRAGAGMGTPAPVVVATAAVEDVPARLRAVARVETFNTVVLMARVQGQVTSVHFKDGQDVKTGDLLYTIDTRPFQAAVHQAEANLARDKAQAVEAQKRAEQYHEAFRSNSAAELTYDQNRAIAEAAVATVGADEAALENARLQLEYCTIRSPIDGKVGERLTDLGNMVTPNVTPLVLINQIEPIYVTFSVPERYVPEIHRRMAAGPLKVEAAIPGDNRPPKQGVLTFLDNRVDAATGMIRLIATFHNRDRELWPGQFVHATLILSIQKNAVVIPSQAIQATQSGDIVYVVKPDNTVEPHPVVPGTVLDSRTVIEKGLDGGQVVVTEGQLRLMPGARVEIQHPATGPGREAKHAETRPG